MRRRLMGLVAVVAAVAAVSGCGITSTGVVGFGSLPSSAAANEPSVPAGDTAYNVYFQIDGLLEPQTRAVSSSVTGEALYTWLLQQIAAGPTPNEIAAGFSQPDPVLSKIQMLSYEPTDKAASAALNVTDGQMSNPDEGQIVCTLNQLNLGQSADDDAFGILFVNDNGLTWTNCFKDYNVVSNVVTTTPS